MPVYCPRCSHEVEKDAAECAACHADFTHTDGWKPTAEPGKWEPKPTGPGAFIQVVGRLVLGGVAWFLFTLVAMFASFMAGSGSPWLALSPVFAVAMLCWVLYPLFRVFASKR